MKQVTGYRLQVTDYQFQKNANAILTSTRPRLPSKFAEVSTEQGMRSKAEERIEIRDEASTAKTPLCATSVEFRRQSGFTILEVILAMAVLALLAGAIYAISMAAMQATHETLEEELIIRRLDGFLRVTRDAFLNLPANGSVYLDTSSGNNIPDLYFEKGSTLFGIPSLGGGTLILSAKARPNGTRNFSILRLPKNIQGSDRDQLYEKGNWISLLPNIIKPHWSFFRNGEWVDEWPQGSGRPQLVRLEMSLRSLPNPIVAIFYLPPTSRMGVVPSLDELLDQLRRLQQNDNSNQPSPNAPMSPPSPVSRTTR